MQTAPTSGKITTALFRYAENFFYKEEQMFLQDRNVKFPNEEPIRLPYDAPAPSPRVPTVDQQPIPQPTVAATHAPPPRVPATLPKQQQSASTAKPITAKPDAIPDSHKAPAQVSTGHTAPVTFKVPSNQLMTQLAAPANSKQTTHSPSSADLHTLQSPTPTPSSCACDATNGHSPATSLAITTMAQVRYGIGWLRGSILDTKYW